MSKGKPAGASRRRKKRLFQMAEGFRAGRKKLVRQVIPTVRHSLVYARRDRRVRKRDFRQLWTARVSAACRLQGVTYGQFVHGLKLAQVQLDRKHLADLAVNDAPAFKQLIDLATAAKN